MTRYDVPLADLERSAHVPVDEQVAEQPVSPPRTYLAPEDLDRARLLSITSAGRVRVD